MGKGKLRTNVNNDCILPLRANLYVHSNYQVQEAFAHLGQALVADLIEVIRFATKSLQ